MRLRKEWAGAAAVSATTAKSTGSTLRVSGKKRRAWRVLSGLPSRVRAPSLESGIAGV